MTATAEQTTHITINIDGHAFHKTPEDALKLAASISRAAKPSSEVTPDRVLATVCGYYDFSPSAMLGRSKPERLAFARQVAMYWMRRLIPEMSLCEIGKFFQRDHGTVIHSYRKVLSDISCNDTHGLIKRSDVAAIGNILTGGMNVAH